MWTMVAVAAIVMPPTFGDTRVQFVVKFRVAKAAKDAVLGVKK